jgi:hypothetical protein
MENPNKIAAIGNVLSVAQQGARGQAGLPMPTDADDVVDQFEALMGQRGDARPHAGALSEHSKLASVVDGLAEDGLAVAEETDATLGDDSLSPNETVLRMSMLAQETRLVGLQLKAFAEMSKQSREGVQTLIRS